MTHTTQSNDSSKKMSVKIVFSGGFHNSPEINLRLIIPLAALRDYAEKKIGARDLIDDYITDYQRRRLENHFCGITGCTCGSWHRADIDTDYLDEISTIDY